MTTVDHFTKIADINTLRSKDSHEVFNALRNAFRKRGIPKKVLADNGKEFTNNRIQELAKELNITWRFGASYTSTTTGMVERVNRTFVEKLRKVSEYGSKDWVDCIQKTLDAYHNSPHRALVFTPKEMEDKRKMAVLRKHREEYRKSYGVKNEGKKGKDIKVSDRILYHQPLTTIQVE
ncbi:Pol polyprotein [Nosema granulosis]|uniref:Pol polyprotein n=1 Tax=Nosema granulosis TaxID=83296 RepID=A0A9P6GX24_9MICR|nr:Pol polyprotein [Nosema granulosis]